MTAPDVMDWQQRQSARLQIAIAMGKLIDMFSIKKAFVRAGGGS